jgi:hypothetical protein
MPLRGTATGREARLSTGAILTPPTLIREMNVGAQCRDTHDEITRRGVRESRLPLVRR